MTTFYILREYIKAKTQQAQSLVESTAITYKNDKCEHFLISESKQIFPLSSVKYIDNSKIVFVDGSTMETPPLKIITMCNTEDFKRCYEKYLQ
jgi:hypothetical protein